MLQKLFLTLLLGQFLGSSGQDSQLTTFLLNEMTNYRSELISLKADIKSLQAELTNVTMLNADLKQQNVLLNQGIATLKTKNDKLEQHIVHNISKLENDISIVDKATNVSVLFIQLEQNLFEKRFEGTLKNVSLEIELLKNLFNTVQNLQMKCCSAVHTNIVSQKSFSELVSKVNGLQSTLNFTKSSVDQLALQDKDVAFSATGAIGNQFQLRGILYPNISTNVGGAFNSSSGIFTAPIDGVYMFHMTDLSINNITNATPFMVNRNRVSGCRGDNHLISELSDCLVILSLHAGDQVWTQDFYEGPFHCSTSQFMGWKL
ncbi:uncharacterized protein LOC133182917 [Saccostrea echinata]|uniref:uncharacterized protein LOC133182917 n=1 Tax=Saccostrea echinata TaxID=191078 RepID=UPI002A82C302|nr:uncharacterized protein LOC133182917 [Saccostrea echinata]